MRDYEKLMFNKLFETEERVTAEALKDKLTSTANVVSSQIRKSFKEPARRIYTTGSKIARRISYILAGVCAGIIGYKTLEGYSYNLTERLNSAVGILFFAGAAIVFAVLIGLAAKNGQTVSKPSKIAAILCDMLLLFGMVKFALSESPGNAYLLYFCGFSAFVCSVSAAFTRKRTAKGNLWLSKIISFQQIIKNQKKYGMNLLAEEKGSLFYELLAYAYVFGKMREWSQRFEGLISDPPV